MRSIWFRSRQSRSAQTIAMIKAKTAAPIYALILLVAPAAALASDQDRGEEEAVHRLSAEEMAEINATREEPRIDAESLLGNNADGRPERRIQSEIAFGIGTSGYRELSASTLIPLGDEGFLALGFGHVEDNLQRRYHYGRGPAF